MFDFIIEMCLQPPFMTIIAEETMHWSTSCTFGKRFITNLSEYSIYQVLLPAYFVFSLTAGERRIV